ncbi:hypothetical protein F4703DRAFT_1841818 [Phycomyces blakesleeanus]
MKACICVDYLSHDWRPTELIRAHREARELTVKNGAKLYIQTNLDPKQQRRLQIEHNKLIRYQNALWRQMAKRCTDQLGQSNQLVSPSAVNWQKESDITWLYGPLYTDAGPTVTPSSVASSPTGLKPVLKRRGQSDSESLDSHPILQRPWPKARSESSVRFNPEVKQMEYIPESPVLQAFDSKTTKTNHKEEKEEEYGDIFWAHNTIIDEQDNEDNEDEEDEDDLLWDLLVQMGGYLRSSARGYLSSVMQPFKPKKRVPISSTLQSTLQMITIVMSVLQSIASLTTTWLMYQSLAPVTWSVRRPAKDHRPPHKARRRLMDAPQPQPPPTSQPNTSITSPPQPMSLYA